MQAFAIINKGGKMINAGVNSKNWFIKECGERFIGNPSNSECECDKSCNIVEHLDYEKSKCRMKLADKSVEERFENVKEVNLAKVTLAEK